MKKHNLLKVLLITLAVVVVMSWIFPITYFSSTGLVEEDVQRIGIFSIMTYAGIAIQYFSHVAIYVLCIGGLYGVLNRIPSYKTLLEKIVKGFKDREIIFIIIAMIVLAVCASVAGMSLPLLFVFPFIISLILMMGYDKITAALVTAGSVVMGMIGSVFSSQDTYGIDAYLGTAADGNVAKKLIVLVIVLAILVVNVCFYAKKHKDNKNVENESYVPETLVGKSNSFWPLVIVMDVVFVVLFLAFFSWNLFGVDVFSNITSKLSDPSITSGSAKTLYTIFGGVLGLSSPFGSWSLLEAAVVLILAAGLLAFVYRIKFNDFISNFITGAKRALKPAVLVLIAYLVLVSSTYMPTLLSVLKPLITAHTGFDVLTIIILAVVFIICGFFSVESYYSASVSLPYIAGEVLAETLSSNALYTGVLAIACQSFYGLSMFIAPTSVVLVSTLAYLNVSYGNWLKAVWKIFLELLVALIIVLSIFTLL